MIRHTNLPVSLRERLHRHEKKLQEQTRQKADKKNTKDERVKIQTKSRGCFMKWHNVAHDSGRTLFAYRGAANSCAKSIATATTN